MRDRPCAIGRIRRVNELMSSGGLVEAAVTPDVVFRFRLNPV